MSFRPVPSWFCERALVLVSLGKNEKRWSKGTTSSSSGLCRRFPHPIVSWQATPSRPPGVRALVCWNCANWALLLREQRSSAKPAMWPREAGARRRRSKECARQVGFSIWRRPTCLLLLQCSCCCSARAPTAAEREGGLRPGRVVQGAPRWGGRRVKRQSGTLAFFFASRTSGGHLAGEERRLSRAEAVVDPNGPPEGRRHA